MLSTCDLGAYHKGLKQQLTRHPARHTFAATVTLASQVFIQVVSKLLGHSDPASIQIYTKITTNHIAQVAAQLKRRTCQLHDHMQLGDRLAVQAVVAVDGVEVGAMQSSCLGTYEFGRKARAKLLIAMDKNDRLLIQQ